MKCKKRKCILILKSLSGFPHLKMGFLDMNQRTAGCCFMESQVLYIWWPGPGLDVGFAVCSQHWILSALEEGSIIYWLIYLESWNSFC